MAKLHISMWNCNSKGGLGEQVSFSSGVPLASTVAAAITLSSVWSEAAAGVTSIGRVTTIGQELVPLTEDVGDSAWLVTAFGGPVLVTVATPGVIPADATHPTYLILSGLSQIIGCIVAGSRIWARDVVL